MYSALTWDVDARRAAIVHVSTVEDALRIIERGAVAYAAYIGGTAEKIEVPASEFHIGVCWVITDRFGFGGGSFHGWPHTPVS